MLNKDLSNLKEILQECNQILKDCNKSMLQCLGETRGIKYAIYDENYGCYVASVFNPVYFGELSEARLYSNINEAKGDCYMLSDNYNSLKVVEIKLQVRGNNEEDE